MTNVLQVLGQKGHTEVHWDPANEEEVEAARAEFEALKSAGFLLFVVTQPDEFPAEAGSVTAQLPPRVAISAAPPPEPAVAPEGALDEDLCTYRRGRAAPCGKAKEDPLHGDETSLPHGGHVWRHDLPKPKAGEQTREFQPKAKRTVAVAPMRGGA